MIAVGHTSVGVILGVTAAELMPLSIPLPTQVLIVGIVGVVSHYAMDLVPHGHYEIDQAKPTLRATIKLLLDLVLPIFILGIYLLLIHSLSQITWLVGAGVLGAQLPDIVNGLRSQKLLPHWSWLELEEIFHASTHWHNPSNPAKATREGGRKLALFDFWQVAMSVAAILLLLTS